MNDFNFKDELKLDCRDRYLPRKKKGIILQKISISKKYLMIGIGLLVLLFLLISIGLVLKYSFSNMKIPESNLNIELDNSLSDITKSNCINDVQINDSTTPNINNNYLKTDINKNKQNVLQNHKQQLELSIDDYSSYKRNNDTHAVNKNKDSIYTPYNKVTTIITPDNKIIAKNKFISSSLTLNNTSNCNNNKKNPIKSTLSYKVKTPEYFVFNKFVDNFIQYVPAYYYTLQLSSASQPKTLNMYAHQHRLHHYLIYETTRKGKPWFILINGVYPSLLQAKNALLQLPDCMKIQKPWIRQIIQVKKDQTKK